MSDFYRIVFKDRKDNCCPYNDADFFFLSKNNKNIGVYNNLKSALHNLEHHTGQCKDIGFLGSHLGMIDNKRSHFQCVSVTYTKKHGLKLEHRLRYEPLETERGRV